MSNTHTHTHLQPDLRIKEGTTLEDKIRRVFTHYDQMTCSVPASLSIIHNGLVRNTTCRVNAIKGFLVHCAMFSAT